MDLLCCHSRRQRGVRRDAAGLVCNEMAPGCEASQGQRAVRGDAASVCNKAVPEWEVEPGMDVILKIVKAELPTDFTVLGFMQSYVNVRCGPAPGLMWTVHRSPTTWSSATSPEWQHACPAQPRAALLGAGPGAEMCIEIMQDAVLGIGEALSIADTGILYASQLLLSGEVGEGSAVLPKHDSGLQELPLWRADENVGTLTVLLSLLPEAPRLQPRLTLQQPGRGLSPNAHLRKARRSVRRAGPPSVPSSSSSSDVSDSELSPYQQLTYFVEKLTTSANASSANSSPQVRSAGPSQPNISVKSPGHPDLSPQKGRLTFGRLRCSQAKPELALMTAHASACSSIMSDSEVSMSPESSVEPPLYLQHCHRAKLGNNGGNGATAYETSDKMQKNGFSHNVHFDSPDGEDQHRARGAERNLPGFPSPQPTRKEMPSLRLPKTGSAREGLGDKDMGTAPHGAQAGAVDASVKKMVKRLQTQARKYPRNDSGWFSQSKERFFAITGELANGATSGTGNGAARSAIRARSLALSWFEDKANFKSHSRPLGSIPMACIRSVALTEPATAGTEVMLRFADVAEDPGQPSRMRLVFESKAAASEWSQCLNEFVDLLREA